MEAPKKIAVVGCGVAGLTAAWLLSRKHSVQLFEKNDYLGGHTRTLKIRQGADAGLPVDTGFIVMNHRNYPLFSRMLEQLEVQLADSSMSFSYFDRASGYGYAGNSAAGLFPELSYFFKGRHLSLLKDLWRFARIGYRDLQNGFLAGKTLGDYMRERKFGTAFLNNYLYPMGAAIWSSPLAQMEAFPAEPYLHFLENHGLLRLTNRPQWRYVAGGSRTYVEAMLKAFSGSAILNCGGIRISRDAEGVSIHQKTGEVSRFDHVVIGAHADEALQLLEDPSEQESRLLGAWRYQPNDVILHTDLEQMPANRKLWASWNFVQQAGDSATNPVTVSYYMNRLQRLKTKQPYIVTLNPSRAISEDSVLNATTLTHPLYSFDSMATQPHLREMNGSRNTWFCGSYFGYGFHEDAVRSAVEVAEKFGISL